MTEKEYNVSLCQLLLENRLISIDELHECVREHEESCETEKPRSLEEVLVERGLLSMDQIEEVARVGEIRRKPRKKVLGNFIIESKLGRGGMGAVFLAKEKNSGEMVAIKILPPISAGDEVYRDRFLREARVALKLKHPNIIQGRKLGNMKDIHYYVMDYIDGEALADMLEDEEPMDPAFALKVTLQVARALQYAAEFEIVHRDIKPENIIITPDGTVKLIDLGLAKPVGPESSVTASGITLGTPHYISPEQIRGEEADFRSDIYSLGITLFEMLAGVPPFDGNSAGVVISKQLNEPMPSVSRVNPEIPRNVEKIVDLMTRKDRYERYQDVSVLITDLEKAFRKLSD